MIPLVMPVFGFLGAQVLSCCSSAACFCACKVLSLSGSTSTRVMYAVVFLLNSLFSWLMMTDWAMARLRDWTHGYLSLECPSGECYGLLAVHRWCFALSLFHVILGLLVLGVDSTRHPRASVQNGWWGLKLGLWLGLVALAFFIPNGFFEVWGNYISLMGSVLFILIQLVLLVDLAHHWCELCLERWEQRGDAKWQWFLVGSTVLLVAVTLALTGVLYGFFAASGCRLNQFFISLNLVLCILVSVLAVHPAIQDANPKSGLAQAAMVSAYATYLVTSAIVNAPLGDDNGTCNPVARSRGTRTTAVVLGAVFTLIAIVYSTSRTATQGRSLIQADDYADENATSAVPLLHNHGRDSTDAATRHQALMHSVETGALPASALTQLNGRDGGDGDDDDDDDDSSSATAVGLDDEKQGVAYNYTFFHFIFVVASMYTAMLLTSWNTVQTVDDSDGLTIIGRSMAAVWVKILSSWASLLLYAWTLVAPVILSDREWA